MLRVALVLRSTDVNPGFVSDTCMYLDVPGRTWMYLDVPGHTLDVPGHTYTLLDIPGHNCGTQ